MGPGVPRRVSYRPPRPWCAHGHRVSACSALGLAAQDAELIALGVGEHHPARTVGAAQVIHGAGAEAQQPGELLVASAGGGDEVKVQPVLDLLVADEAADVTTDATGTIDDELAVSDDE